MMDYSAAERYFKSFEELFRVYPKAKKIALLELEKSMVQDVWEQIPARGIDDSWYHVRNWQEGHIGSGGGYVAVRPVTQTVQTTRAGKTTSSRAITQYLDRGHGARRPSGKTERYRPQIVKAGIGSAGNAYVKGHLFYSFAKVGIEDRAVRSAEHILVQLENKFDV